MQLLRILLLNSIQTLWNSALTLAFSLPCLPLLPPASVLHCCVLLHWDELQHVVSLSQLCVCICVLVVHYCCCSSCFLGFKMNMRSLLTLVICKALVFLFYYYSIIFLYANLWLCTVDVSFELFLLGYQFAWFLCECEATKRWSCGEWMQKEVSMEKWKRRKRALESLKAGHANAMDNTFFLGPGESVEPGILGTHRGQENQVWATFVQMLCYFYSSTPFAGWHFLQC